MRIVEPAPASNESFRDGPAGCGNSLPDPSLELEWGRPGRQHRSNAYAADLERSPGPGSLVDRRRVVARYSSTSERA